MNKEEAIKELKRLIGAVQELPDDVVILSAEFGKWRETYIHILKGSKFPDAQVTTETYESGAIETSAEVNGVKVLWLTVEEIT